jgi:galactokinase
MNEHLPKRLGVYTDRTLFRSPGRVNLIGEHTDYTDGLVMPVAIDREIWMAASPSEEVRILSLNLGKETRFSLDKVEKGNDWSDYIRGVAFFLQKSIRKKLAGMDGAIDSTIPIASGLSSSAALEVLAATVFEKFSGIKISPLRIIKICKRAENEWVGVNCGIMDQYASKLGKKKNAMFLDCLKLKHEYVPIPAEVKIVVVDTGIRRSLASSKYNERREECRIAEKILKKKLGRVSISDFESKKGNLEPAIRKRAKHVVYENRRVLLLRDALREEDFESCRKIMDESHFSLAKDYEVSCFHLDIAQGIARKIQGCYGSRMTGAGFGGCTVNLVDEERVKDFQEIMEREYEIRTGRKCKIYICTPVDGAGVLNGDSCTS